MKTIKKLGIWMDHSNAHLIECTGNMETKIILSGFTYEEKVQSLGKSENLMHNKEQHLQSAYYKNLMDVIAEYHEVVIFGPTSAKAELLNLVKNDHRFEKIKIVAKQTDKITENQQQAFVKDYFENAKITVSE